MSLRRTVLSIVILVATLAASPRAGAGNDSTIATSDLREWLTYISSDQLEGRAVYSAGFGLAAAYIREHLREWGISPQGDPGEYLQTVRVLGVRTTSRSSVTVRVGRRSRTFRDGDGITFPRNMGARQTLTLDRVEFAGYGLDAPGVHYSDLTGRDISGAAVVFLGGEAPKAVDQVVGRRLLFGRGRWLTDQAGAAAAVGPAPAGGGPDRQRDQAPSPGEMPRADFTTTQRLDQRIAPSVTADDTFLRFLFSDAPTKYDELKRKAADGEALPGFTLKGVTLTFDIDADYEIVRTQLTQNIVAVVPGSDPALRSTYVALGAHYDHVGYAQGELTDDQRRPSAPGRITPGAEADRIWNGADDDGSGTTALMAIAHAFAQGPRPRRSILLVWHAGEERGLLGSRYFADHPTVPIDHIVAQLNIDMIGRNRDDQRSEENTVYVVGSDRISSELHQVNIEANRSLAHPMTLDYEMNDPADPEQLYFRSDHYSYAAKGIPVIFFTTGLHPDYHANTDEVSKIDFPKLTRVTEMVYETARRLANLDHAPVRDFKGPRAGRGTRE